MTLPLTKKGAYRKSRTRLFWLFISFGQNFGTHGVG